MALRRNSLALASLAWAFSGAAALAQVPCANEIGPLRAAVEKNGNAIKAAVEKKAAREEVCSRFKSFAAAEGKFVKYIETNASWCGVPAEAVKQLKDSHNRTLKMRGQACAAGPVGGQAGPPAGPGLSEALGTARAPAPNNGNDRGTYNSLTGNVLAR